MQRRDSLGHDLFGGKPFGADKSVPTAAIHHELRRAGISNRDQKLPRWADTGESHWCVDPLLPETAPVYAKNEKAALVRGRVSHRLQYGGIV